MGENKVNKPTNPRELQKFTRSLLQDIKSLDYMLQNNWFEKGIHRIGAEQEMVLIDVQNYRPDPINIEVISKLEQYDWLDTELAMFNLETNFVPREFTGDCFSQMMEESTYQLKIIREALVPFNADLILTGILPTIRKSDLEDKFLTPKKRYLALMEAVRQQMTGDSFEFRLSGIDELMIKHDSPLLEACNTSFQVHLQVSPEQFAKFYNVSQALAGPIMAIAANSPLVFGRRLWHESRIAMFQQALDTRGSRANMRERSARVHFGRDWVNESILEIHKEDISRYRVLLAADVTEDSQHMISEGKVPKLSALQVHNSTVYRWNRPCYGISANGKPHLRIENRVFPSGPTAIDEIANSAFWLGCMVGLPTVVDDIRQKVSFADISDNFVKSAQFGIDSKFNWFDDQKIPAVELILKELLPIARTGLKIQKVDDSDIDKYLGIIEDRAKSHMNGARWQLRAYTKLLEQTNRTEALTVMTSAMLKYQKKNTPIHKWKMPELKDLRNYKPQKLLVGDFMTTDLLTVQQDDIIEFVAELMDWRKIRYMPVEDNSGKLIGLVSSRLLLKHFTEKNRKLKLVKDIMIKKPITANPSTTIMEAMALMRKNKIGCLPVVQEQELIGIFTEMDFIGISSRLMERLSDQENQAEDDTD
ncbi:MAG: CBS domain-containing protein [Saprospiraceae bacterium]|jgi:CBS domain-containing protein/gamma-glutamylcysteine synthetase|nr:CBS domain-containing protein [Saprospiraceae bacterium]MBK7436117.1 CBS domain-containing protein [Saprospiraceae bacterium]MBK8281453.1 CBS domain-containing protein [Saprospiraceae bacterium]MBK8514244.1 CBS domain-containing protein [Saprospiraceae bacterium]MBP7921305.1 CBS domain-containing protein [Saprospiraceae bacterium]